jgi:hypothetical protein
MTSTNYVRVRFQTPNGKRTVWAVKLGPNRYVVSDKHGDTATPAGVDASGAFIERKEIIFSSAQDVVWEKPARMSLKYAELEVV